MSTDFNINTIQIEGSIRPKSIDTPLDIRTRVETEKDILSIPSPYIGMVVYVKDTGKRFEILTLKDKKQGLTTTKNAAVGTYREIISKFDTAIDLKPKELPVLKNKLLKVRTQIYNNQVKERRLLRAITPNIVIRELPFYDISEEHCCFEYHINDKSLFLDKF